MNSSETLLYEEDDMLQLSGIQHYMFCPRQWALIQLDQIWEDNYLTTEGILLHQHVDNPFLRETGHTAALTLRGIRIASHTIGLSGITDALEIHPHDNAPSGKKALLASRMFDALPVEYKRGKPKTNDCDRMQVASQALILEEMLSIHIDKGAIFYWETRHREYVDIDDAMKEKVRVIAKEMHEVFDSRKMPTPVKRKECKSCSLIDQCLPALNGKDVKKYLKESLLQL